MKRFSFVIIFIFAVCSVFAQVAESGTYLGDIKKIFETEWPANRTVNIVFHGHSVPSGYAKTPVVNTLEAYPHKVLVALKAKYPFAVINTIVTAIGGENSEQGAKRFKKDVLMKSPDVVFIDYILNDRGIGVGRAEKAWRKMITASLKVGTKVVLLTPTPDLSENINDKNAPLNTYSDMVRSLAKEYHLAIVDSYLLFCEIAASEENLDDYMSQVNHPNGNGHSVVSDEIMKTLF